MSPAERRHCVLRPDCNASSRHRLNVRKTKTRALARRTEIAQMHTDTTASTRIVEQIESDC